jgi:hypothetical protein
LVWKRELKKMRRERGQREREKQGGENTFFH